MDVDEPEDSEGGESAECASSTAPTESSSFSSELSGDGRRTGLAPGEGVRDSSPWELCESSLKAGSKKLAVRS
jgi:hypothetical protein